LNFLTQYCWIFLIPFLAENLGSYAFVFMNIHLSVFFIHSNPNYDYDYDDNYSGDDYGTSYYDDYDANGEEKSDTESQSKK